MRIERHDGTTWELGEPFLTSDGDFLVTGVLIEPETGEQVLDEEGYPITHSFFIGSVVARRRPEDEKGTE